MQGCLVYGLIEEGRLIMLGVIWSARPKVVGHWPSWATNFQNLATLWEDNWKWPGFFQMLTTIHQIIQQPVLYFLSDPKAKSKEVSQSNSTKFAGYLNNTLIVLVYREAEWVLTVVMYKYNSQFILDWSLVLLMYIFQYFAGNYIDILNGFQITGWNEGVRMKIM